MCGTLADAAPYQLHPPPAVSCSTSSSSAPLSSPAVPAAPRARARLPRPQSAPSPPPLFLRPWAGREGWHCLPSCGGWLCGWFLLASFATAVPDDGRSTALQSAAHVDRARREMLGLGTIEPHDLFPFVRRGSPPWVIPTSRRLPARVQFNDA